MVTVSVPQAFQVNADGYARASLSNVADAVLYARIMELGLPFSLLDTPRLNDFVGTTYQGDPTGRNSSYKALKECAAQASSVNAALRAKFIEGGIDPSLIDELPGAVAKASPGTWVHDDVSLDFWYGGGLMMEAPLIEGATPGLFGCTILRPHRTGYDLEVPFAIHSGNRFSFAVHYPDRLAEAANIDAAGNGELVQYAPTFATDHSNDYTGAVSSNVNTSFFYGDTPITGANTGPYLGEATLSEEEWAVSPSGRVFSAQSGRGCGGYYWNIRGMCLDRGIVRNRMFVSSSVDCNGNGFGPQAWQDGSNSNLHAYLQKNCTFHTMGHRATGFRLGISGPAKVRHCAQVLRFHGGVAPIGWTAGGGVDNGRYASGEMLIRTEDCPNVVTWEADAWPQGVLIDYNGRAKDFYSTTNVIPAIQHLTDADIAGDLRKPSDAHPNGWWRPCTNFGMIAEYRFVSRISVGPVITVDANNPQGLIWFHTGSRFSSWNTNQNHAVGQAAYGFQHLAAANNVTIKIGDSCFSAKFGTDYIFYGTADTSGTALTNPNYGQLAGYDVSDQCSYFGYVNDPADPAYNWNHFANIASMWGGKLHTLGLPDDDGNDDGGD